MERGLGLFLSGKTGYIRCFHIARQGWFGEHHGSAVASCPTAFETIPELNFGDAMGNWRSVTAGKGSGAGSGFAWPPIRWFPSSGVHSVPADPQRGTIDRVTQKDSGGCVSARFLVLSPDLTGCPLLYSITYNMK